MSQETLKTCLDRMIEMKASDLHLKVDHQPRLRIHGKIKILEGIAHLNNEQLSEAISAFVNINIEACLLENGSVDGTLRYLDNRFRFSLYKQSGKLAAAIRNLAATMPDIDLLGLPDSVKKFCDYGNGLILVCGPTGSGKSTTLAALVNNINQNQERHIITIEDPVEFEHNSKRSLINQREVGVDVPDFYKALVASLRQDPDIIVLGEIRDSATIRTAISAAETGHLVMATVHADDSIGAIERILSAYKAEELEPARRALSIVLRAIIAQKLLPISDTETNKEDRVLLCEILINNSAVANQIASGKITQIRSSLQTGRAHGMLDFASHLRMLHEEGLINRITRDTLVN